MLVLGQFDGYTLKTVNVNASTPSQACELAMKRGMKHPVMIFWTDKPSRNSIAYGTFYNRREMFAHLKTAYRLHYESLQPDPL